MEKTENLDIFRLLGGGSYGAGGGELSGYVPVDTSEHISKEKP